MKKERLGKVCVISMVACILFAATASFVAEGVDVDAEYISGLLTASSIVLGFWASLYGTGRVSRSEKKGFLQVSAVILGWLSVGAVSVFLAGLKRIAPSISLGLLLTSFLVNVIMLVYYFVFQSFEDLLKKDL